MSQTRLIHKLNKKRVVYYGPDWRSTMIDRGVIVDKSEFIAEVFDRPEKISLIIRPHGFGKTFALNMLYDFLNSSQRDSHIQLLKIWFMNEGNYQKYRNKFSVIRFYFDRSLVNSLEAYMDYIKFKMYGQFTECFSNIKHQDNTFSVDSLKYLIDKTFAKYNKKIILLIDNIDQPLRDAIQHDFYDEMLLFIQQFLSHAFESQQYIEKIIITGRYALPGYQTLGMHLYTVFDKGYSKHFGFSETETLSILNEIFKPDDAKELFLYIQEWYKGYKIGEETLLHPKMILNFIGENTRFPRTWLDNKPCLNNHMDDNSILISFNNYLKKNRFIDSFEKLLVGQPIHSNITFEIDNASEKKSTDQSIANKLFSAGYLALKQEDSTSNQCAMLQSHKKSYSLVIPNKKIRTLIEKFIKLNKESIKLDKQRINDWIKLNKQKKELEDILHRQVNGNYLFFSLLSLNSLVFLGMLNPCWLTFMGFLFLILQLDFSGYQQKIEAH